MAIGKGFHAKPSPALGSLPAGLKLLQALNCVCLYKVLIPQTLTCQERQSNPCFTPPPPPRSLSLSLSPSSSFSRCFTVLISVFFCQSWVCLYLCLSRSCVSRLSACTRIVGKNQTDSQYYRQPGPDQQLPGHGRYKLKLIIFLLVQPQNIPWRRRLCSLLRTFLHPPHRQWNRPISLVTWRSRREEGQPQKQI